MTGTQLGQLVLALIGIAIVVAIFVWLLNWLYLRSSKERAFVRTGFGGQKVVMNGGALVLPVLHEIIPVNMNTLRLEVCARPRAGAHHQGPHARGRAGRVLRARAAGLRGDRQRRRRRSASAPCSPSS